MISRLKKCIYTGHAAEIYTDYDAAEVIKIVGSKVKHVESIPFAIRILSPDATDNETRSYHEDNGDWGVGEWLGEFLEQNESSNTILIVTRVVKGCFPPESVQSIKYPTVKEAAMSALTQLIVFRKQESDRLAAELAARTAFFQQTRASILDEQQKNLKHIESLATQINERELDISKTVATLTSKKSKRETYEEIVQQISELEVKRDHLEGEIERNEELSHHLNGNKLTNASASTAIEGAISDLRKRYFTSKEELTAFRVDKKALDEEYKGIMKEVKHFEQVEKSLAGLKDSLFAAADEQRALDEKLRHFLHEFELR